MLGLLRRLVTRAEGSQATAQDRLFVFHMEGCHVCAEARRTVLKPFRAANPQLKILTYDITTLNWGAETWSPDTTPTLVHLRPDGTWSKYDGTLDQATGRRIIDFGEMRRWLGREFR